MRILLLTRGLQGAGKDYWVKQNGLEPYTLSADNIRLLLQSPETTLNGNTAITQKNDGKVWKLLFEILEQRMQRGELVVVNATHYKSSLLSRYNKLISKYRYRAYIVDFTDISLETCLERNRQREAYKFVPEDVIKKVHALFEAEKNNSECKEISNKFTILPYTNAVDSLKENLLFDYNDKYEKIVVFGDIHGCYEPIKNYFDKNPINDNYKYIFTGDYIDRGIQNKEVLEFALQNMNKHNFLFLEGNHEGWLRKYCSKDYQPFTPPDEDKKVLEKYLDKDLMKDLYKNNIQSRVFLKDTAPQIEDLSKSDLRQFCRTLGQMAYFKFGDKKYLVTHGGLPCEPTIFTSTDEMIKGVGKYEDLDELYSAWNKNTDNCVQIHAHRNIFDLPTRVEENIYNLCDKPEFGKFVRVIEISKDNNIEVVLEPSTVYDKTLVDTMNAKNIEIKNNDNFLQQLNSSKLIQKKILSDGVVSYNFTREAFRKQKWNELTIKARGLFVDSQSEKVVARGYDKFKNWSEDDTVSSSALKQTLQFPVYAYRKENGFLALISYNPKTDDLFVASKSTNQGDFAQMIHDEINKLGDDFKQRVKEFCKRTNYTLIFECINQDLDPHIIKYDKNELILLDAVENLFDTNFLSYPDLVELSKKLGVKVKQLECTFNSWDELYAFKKEQDKNYSHGHEGWVFVDSQGFMVKYKTNYYKFWKQMRKIKQDIEKGRELKKTFINEDEVRVINLMRTIPAENLQSMSIIDVEEMYYSSLDK